MPDRLELDLVSIPPTYKGTYLTHGLAVPADELEPLVEELAQSKHGQALYELPALEIDQVRQAVQADMQSWARKRRYHIANCAGCTGGAGGEGGDPED